MKRAHIFILPLMVCMLFFVTSCQRNSEEVVEDTKTAGRYVGKGFRSLFGKHGESRQVASPVAFQALPEEEYIPLDDEDLYRELSLGDVTALDKIDQDSAIPQSREMPGELGSEIPGIEGFYEPTGAELSQVFRNIQFGYNEYVVRGGENLSRVDRIAAYMQKNPNIYIFVEGHCDERGSQAYNLALGSRRSSSVRNLLIKGGIDLNRIFTISYGKERPISSNHDADGWRLNRRAQFKLYQKAR